MKSKVVHHRSEILISLAKEVLFSPDEFGACSIPCFRQQHWGISSCNLIKTIRL